MYIYIYVYLYMHMYICISRYHLIRYDFPFHLVCLCLSLFLSLIHTIMIYNYRLIRRFARPDQRIVAFRVCVSLVSDAPHSDFCAPFKTGLTISGHVAVHLRASSWTRSILSRSEQATPIPRFIQAAKNTRFEDLSLSFSCSPDTTIPSAWRSIRKCWNKSKGMG